MKNAFAAHKSSGMESKLPSPKDAEEAVMVVFGERHQRLMVGKQGEQDHGMSWDSLAQRVIA